MRFLRFFLTAAAFPVVCIQASAQNATNSADSAAVLMNQLETKNSEHNIHYITATFKYTRIIDGQSVENLPARVLDFRILHRFGPLSAGLYNFFGLDYSPFNVKIGFDYGITNNFMIGIAHSGYDKLYDAFFKWRILRQSTGAKNAPVSISFVPTFAFNTLDPSQIDPAVKPDSATEIKRTSYVLQLLIARKFSEGLALQVMPSYIHADNISYFHSKPDILAIGIAGRQRLSRMIEVNAEYYYQVPGLKAPGSHNALSLGIAIGTGGHVFELLISNSQGLTEKSFITETNGRWDNAGALFGFNISRVFQLGKKHR